MDHPQQTAIGNTANQGYSPATHFLLLQISQKKTGICVYSFVAYYHARLLKDYIFYVPRLNFLFPNYQTPYFLFPVVEGCMDGELHTPFGRRFVKFAPRMPWFGFCDFIFFLNLFDLF